MKNSAALVVSLVLVALASFSLGLLVGHRTFQGYEARQRLDVLERRVAAISARTQGAAGGPARPGQEPALEPVSIRIDGAPSRGPASASVVMVEFSDFQCPFCLRAHPTIERLRKEYPEDLRLVFKHFPLSFHKEAMNAHRAVLAARKQERFWEMHDLIMAKPDRLAEEHMRDNARELGLDLARFDSDFASPEVAKQIDLDIQEGKEVGVRGTPAFFINGRLLAGAQPYEVFKSSIEEALAEGS